MQEVREIPEVRRIGKPFIEWCQQVVKSDGWRILDTETTGLKKNSQVVELAIVDMAGKTLYNCILKPTCKIEQDAINLHHISEEMVKDAPPIADEWESICAILDGKRIITYGAKFDMERLSCSAKAHGLTERPWSFYCAMKAYSAWYDAPRRNGYSNAPWQKLSFACQQQGITLPPDAHRALPDAQATRTLLWKVAMAGYDSPTYHAAKANREDPVGHNGNG